MAEIRVERKERRSWLPWIMGLVLLALVVWGLAGTANREGAVDETGSAAVDVQIPEPPPALRQYAMRATRIFEEAA